MTKHLNYIREKLNKAFPERLELKFGCEVVTYHNRQDDKEIVGKYLRTDDSDEGEYWVDSWHIQDNIPGWGSQPRINECAKLKEILGTPPTILEVLRWFGKKYEHLNCIDTRDGLAANFYIQKNRTYIEISASWYDGSNGVDIGELDYDLSKPLIRDQSPETIKQLAELMGYKE